MKIFVTDYEPKDSLKRSHQKGAFTKEMAVIDLEAGKAIAVARFYETKSRVYCCFFSFTSPSSGSGYAGGYGYHKESAALEAALSAGGFTFSTHWGGAGSGAMEQALLSALKHASGQENLLLHTAHG